jgi:hypothetical protein
VLARDPAEAAAEREAGDPGERDVAGRGGEAVLLRRTVELPQQDARLSARDPVLGVHLHALLPGEVDDHSVVAHRVARDVVAAAAHGDREPMTAGEAQRGDHVVFRRAPRDQRGAPVDHPIPDAARGLVLRIARSDELAAERPS